MFKLLTFLAFMSSGLYLWKSGLPQVSHMLIVFLCALSVLYYKRLVLKNYYIFLFAFVSYSTVLNLFYYLELNDIQFVFSSVQVIFNSFVFLGLVTLFNSNESLKFSVYYGVVASYVLQWFILILGLGNYSLAPRYAGSFNDPNQMAYWFLATQAICLSIQDKVLPKKTVVYFSLITFFVFIALSISRSAMLAIIVFLGLYAVKFRRRQFIFLIIFCLISLLVPINGKVSVENDIIMDRLTNIESGKQADERGYTRFVEHPSYIPLGSGQGAHFRFNENKAPAFLNVEMHTTWGGLLFYYGVVGLSCISAFLLYVFRPISSFNRILLLSTFFYGLTTYSFRTPIFWLLLAVIVSFGGLSSERKE